MDSKLNNASSQDDPESKAQAGRVAGTELFTTELVIFDFDGVVADSEVISLSELQKALHAFGVKMSVDEVRAKFLGSAINKIEAFLDTDSAGKTSEGFARKWYDALFARFAKELTVMPGLIDLLDALDQREVPYCIASGGSFERLGVALKATLLTNRFKNRIFSADLVEHGKPAPDLFLHAAREMGASPEKCLVIEDSPAGIVAAKKAGMRALGFVGGSHLKDRIEVHSKDLLLHRANRVMARFNETLREL